MVLCAETLEHLPVGVYERSLGEIERVAHHYILVTTPNEEYLPAGFARCDSCRHTYHMNLHFRTFDQEAHSALFRQFELVRSEGILSWKHNPLVVLLRHRLFGLYKFKESLICPYCGYQGAQQPRQGLMWKAIFRVVRGLERRLPARSKARWIASLYQRA
jgi:hypothetical protein